MLCPRWYEKPLCQPLKPPALMTCTVYQRLHGMEMINLVEDCGVTISDFVLSLTWSPYVDGDSLMSASLSCSKSAGIS